MGGMMESKRRILLTTPHAVTTTPAPVASFNTDMVGKLRSAKFAFNPTQSGSGNPSPTNVRPISGWDGVTAYRTEKNLFDVSSYDRDARLSTSGQRYQNNGYYLSSFISVKPGVTYTKNSPTVDAYHSFCTYSADNEATFIRKIDNSNSITIEAGENYIRFCGLLEEADTAQLEIGSTATPYTPYVGSTYPVTWQSAGTIYGGYVDVCKGVVVAEWVSCSFEGDVCSTLWYDVDSSRDTLGFYRSANIWSNIDYPTPVDGGGIFDYCKVGAVYNENTPWVARFLFMNGSFNRFEMRLPKSVLADITSESAARQSAISYLDAHPLQAVYKISPITYAITPTIIKSLKGANNLWSNANGDTTITYWTH